MSEHDALVEDVARRITKARYGGDVFMDNRQANPTTGDRNAARDIIAAVREAALTDEAILTASMVLFDLSDVTVEQRHLCLDAIRQTVITALYGTLEDAVSTALREEQA